MESKAEKQEPKRITDLYIGNVDGEPVVNRQRAIERERWLESELNRYKSTLAGIPNPEAVRELVESAMRWRKAQLNGGSLDSGDKRLMKAIAALSAPSPGAQQK